MTMDENLHPGSEADDIPSTTRVHLSKSASRVNQDAADVPLKAIFHLRVTVISRSSHRCVLHCVAYRSGCQMRGGDGEIVADYTRRKGVTHCQIVAPQNSPEWVMERNTLWIEAAKAEKRKNSIEARELEVTIPYGLTREQAIALACEFASEMVAKHQFVVDFSLHLDNRKDWTGAYKNYKGYHVHFLLTTRRINQGGFGEKTRELDLKTSGAVRYWRERWQDLANGYLLKNGSQLKIDHRSNKQRGIQRLPTKPLGPAVTAFERRGVRTVLGNKNRSLLEESTCGGVRLDAVIGKDE